MSLKLKKQKLTMTAAEMKANNILMTVNEPNRWLEPPFLQIAVVFYVKYRDSQRKVFTRMRHDIMLRLRVYMDSSHVFKKIKSSLVKAADEYLLKVDSGDQSALHMAPDFETWILKQQLMLESRFGAGAVPTDANGVASSSAGSNTMNASMALLVDLLGNLAASIRRIADTIAPEDDRPKKNVKGSDILDRLGKASKTKPVASGDETESSSSEDQDSDDEVKVVPKPAPSPASPTPTPAPSSASPTVAVAPSVANPSAASIPTSVTTASPSAPVLALPQLLAVSAPTSSIPVVLRDNSNLNQVESLEVEIARKAARDRKKRTEEADQQPAKKPKRQASRGKRGRK